MITTDFKEVLFPIKKVQLVVDKTHLPAGYGILANDRIIHQVLTDYTPKENKELLDEVDSYFRMNWRYCYYDIQRCNFAMVGTLADVIYTINDTHQIVPGIEILNSYNQRMSPQMYWCFYHLGLKCYIKTNFQVEFLGDANEAYKIYLLIDGLLLEDFEPYKFSNTKQMPTKVAVQVDSIINEIFMRHGKNNFSALLCVSKAITDYWEHTSYELSRKYQGSLVDMLLENSKNKFAYSENVKENKNDSN